MTEKNKRQKRFQQKKRHIERQVKNYNDVMGSYKKWAENDGVPLTGYRPGGKDRGQSNHRFHKKNALNCGDPKCIMCGNPRKFFGEVTQQERKFYAEPLDFSE